MDHAYKRRIPTKQLSAMIAIGPPTNTDTSTWVSDNGASNYITNDLANLMVHDSYRGADKVVIGNGAGLPISHIGSSTFSHNFSAFKLSLSYIVLIFPLISSLFISLPMTITVFFVFFNDYFL